SPVNARLASIVGAVRGPHLALGCCEPYRTMKYGERSTVRNPAECRICWWPAPLYSHHWQVRPVPRSLAIGRPLPRIDSQTSTWSAENSWPRQTDRTASSALI